MKPAPFEYVRAESVEHAVSELASRGPSARVLAGGQSLVPLLNQREISADTLVDITRVAGLSDVERRDGLLQVGALVTQAELERRAGPSSPLLAQCLPYTGHFVTRNRGTVGGTIAHADPHGELPLVLLVAGGTVTVRSARGARTLAAGELFTGPCTTALTADELIVDTAWPVAGPGDGQAFAEVAMRHGDYMLAAAACTLRREGGRVTDARIGVGGVSDRPVLVPAATALLRDRAVDAALAAEAGAAAAAGIDSYDDLHAPAAYRRHLAGVLVEQVVCRAWEAASA
jgi:CO/xanthine dehydrogenase FAD-binding subunit